MEISDVRVKLIEDSSDRLKAVCSITLDEAFVVRDLKVVEGVNGLFVAMPSRKLSVHCPQCRGKNHLRARFCNECGAKLPPARIVADPGGRVRMHRDVAHPINPAFREIVQSRVIEKYHEEAELAKSPDYRPVEIDQELEESHEIQQPVQQPEAQEEPENDAYATSEYDQLIAGLNKGSQERGQERGLERTPERRPEPGLERGPRPVGRPPRAEPRTGERSGSDTGRTRSPSPAPPPRAQPPRREGDDRGAAPRGRGSPPPSPRPAYAGNVTDEGAEPNQDFGRGIEPEPAAPKPDRSAPVRRAERPSPPPSPVFPASDGGDETPFGAGIL